eukprot:2492329-Alexandrium_andersonii.AAC.1
MAAPRWSTDEPAALEAGGQASSCAAARASAADQGDNSHTSWASRAASIGADLPAGIATSP